MVRNIARNLYRYGVFAIAALLLASCAVGTLVDSPTGSISFAFPQGALSRGLEGGETYKVVIYYGLDRYDAEPEVSGDELTFSDIPTGDVRIIVAKGTVGSDGFFYSKEYGQLFITIVAGDNGPYDLDLDTSEFTSAVSLMGKNVNGLAVLGDTVYASTSNSLALGGFDGSELSIDGSGAPDVPPGITVNSISVGKVYDGVDPEPDEQIWVNGTWSEATGGGIMPWLPGATDLDTSFSEGFGNTEYREDGIVTDVTVKHSGAFEVSIENLDGLAIMFQRDGGMGGIYLKKDEFDAESHPSSDRPWIIDEIDFDELLSDVVEEGTEFIKDFTVSESSSAAYIATSLVTMKVSEDMVSEDVEFTSPDDILNSKFIAYAPYLGSDVVCIDLWSDDAGEIIYLGTENGLFAGSASADPDTFFDGGGSLVAGTAGYYINLVSASPEPDDPATSEVGSMVAFAARRGENPDLLIIVNNETDEVVDFRGLQGLPGTRLSNLVWLDEETLLVSGNHGVAAINAAALF